MRLPPSSSLMCTARYVHVEDEDDPQHYDGIVSKRDKKGGKRTLSVRKMERQNE